MPGEDSIVADDSGGVGGEWLAGRVCFTPSGAEFVVPVLFIPLHTLPGGGDIGIPLEDNDMFMMSMLVVNVCNHICL